MAESPTIDSKSSGISRMSASFGAALILSLVSPSLAEHDDGDADYVALKADAKFIAGANAGQ